MDDAEDLVVAEVDSNHTLLLCKALSPTSGGLQWAPIAENTTTASSSLAEHEATLAPLRYWFPPMLNDTYRATCYRTAINQAVARARDRLGRAPIVLDIGASLNVPTEGEGKMG